LSEDSKKKKMESFNYSLKKNSSSAFNLSEDSKKKKTESFNYSLKKNSSSAF